MSRATMLRMSGLLASIAAISVVAAGGPASASTSSKAGATVITMEQEGKELFFDGPGDRRAGRTLKVKNNTNPRKIGPHTFSLVKSRTLPDTKRGRSRTAAGSSRGSAARSSSGTRSTSRPARSGEPGRGRQGRLGPQGQPEAQGRLLGRSRGRTDVQARGHRRRRQDPALLLRRPPGDAGQDQRSS